MGARIGFDFAGGLNNEKQTKADPIYNVTAKGDRVVGPGTNTSSTTAAMLTAARALVAAGVEPENDLVFAAVAQEETGLDGMRDLYREYGDDR